MTPPELAAGATTSETTSESETAVAELAAALRRREPAAFTRLLAEYGTVLYRLARRLTGDAGDAEDVVQEVLLTAYAKIDTLQDPTALGGWLRRIAVNTALMRLRARGQEPAPMPGDLEWTPQSGHVQLPPGWSIQPEDMLLRQEVREVLGAAVDRLSGGARAVYVLAEIEGVSYSETAGLLGISEGAVRVRLHRARLALRDALEYYFRDQSPTRETHS